MVKLKRWVYPVFAIATTIWTFARGEWGWGIALLVTGALAIAIDAVVVHLERRG